MKKTLVLLICLVGAINMQAQDKAARIKEIRQAYAEAKKDIANNGKKGHPRMDMTISVNDGTVVSEDFNINEESERHYYFKRIRTQEDTDLFEPRCYFLTESWSANGHTSYREMLFDPYSHHLMFSYMKAETHAGFVVESRYYYDNMGNLIDDKHKVGNHETTADEHSWSTSGGDQTMAMAFIVLFNDLMKHSEAKSEEYRQTQVANKAEQMKHIRSLYAQAKQKVAKDAKSSTPFNVQIEIHDQADPGMPPQKDVLKCWYERIEGIEDAKCYFMSSTCTLGDHHVYSEYLFEPEDARLLFCFSQQEQNDGPALEWRYYFDNKGHCIEAKGQDAKFGPGFADKKAADLYLETFNALVNPHN